MQKGRNSEALDAPINLFSAVHGPPTPILSKVISPKTVSGESANVYSRKWMDFASNYVVSKIPNFMDLGLSPANAMDKLKSVIRPNTIVERFTDISN